MFGDKISILILLIININFVIFLITSSPIAPRNDWSTIWIVSIFVFLALMVHLIARITRDLIINRVNYVTLIASNACMLISSLFISYVFTEYKLPYLFWLAGYERGIAPGCDWGGKCQFISELEKNTPKNQCNDQYCSLIYFFHYLSEDQHIVVRIKNYDPRQDLEKFFDKSRDEVKYVTNVGSLAVVYQPRQP